MKTDLFEGIAPAVAPISTPISSPVAAPQIQPPRFTPAMEVHDLKDERAHCCIRCGALTGFFLKQPDGGMVFLCAKHREAI